jgi:hypothetical protein
MTTTALVLASVALAVAVPTATLAVLVMRQNADTTRDLRHHRTAHQRTHGRADPDPEHHGTSPTVTRLAADLEALSAMYEELIAWAEVADKRLRRPDDDPPPAAMYATDETLTAERAAQLRAHPEQLHPADTPTAALPAADRPGPRP